MIGTIATRTFLALFVLTIPVRAAGDNPLSALLHERLWSKRDAYDAAHVLMTPMVSAYDRGDEAAVSGFRRFMSRFLEDTDRPDLGRLTGLQFSYLVSQFVFLETRQGECMATAKSAAVYLEHEVVEILDGPAWQWGRQPFPTMFARIRWKLDSAPTHPSYLRAIIDEEMFALSISADLSRALPACGLAVSPDIKKAVGLGYEILSQEGKFEEDGWLFQRGVWTDYPDYLHAGNTSLGPDLPKRPVKGIGEDSSHSSRWPLWLQSFRCAAPRGSRKRAAMGRIADGMQRQLLGKIIRHGTSSFPGVRMKNFMTGENGVYRYDYATVGKGGGYGPFGLSFTFNLGWWSFLGNALEPYYRDQIGNLPFTEPVMTLYTQPAVTDPSAPRTRNPLFKHDNYLRGNLIETVLSAAEVVASHGRRCPAD